MRCGIEPHIPLLDREHQTNGFAAWVSSRGDFTFITRNFFEAEREQVRALQGIEAFEPLGPRTAQDRDVDCPSEA
jgi:hypothetical protein